MLSSFSCHLRQAKSSFVFVFLLLFLWVVVVAFAKYNDFLCITNLGNISLSFVGTKPPRQISLRSLSEFLHFLGNFSKSSRKMFLLFLKKIYLHFWCKFLSTASRIISKAGDKEKQSIAVAKVSEEHDDPSHRKTEVILELTVYRQQQQKNKK